jgi:hypothetical protein
MSALIGSSYDCTQIQDVLLCCRLTNGTCGAGKKILHNGI